VRHQLQGAFEKTQLRAAPAIIADVMAPAGAPWSKSSKSVTCFRTTSCHAETAPKRDYRLVLPDGLGKLVGRGLSFGGRTSRLRQGFRSRSAIRLLSSDREQEYFSDGITDDSIADLSRWQAVSVHSANSTFRKVSASTSRRLEAILARVFSLGSIPAG
jgi:hypothetical protein